MSSAPSRPVYLDYAATTPVDPVVAARMAEHLTLDGVFGNPASRSHVYGWEAEEAVEAARAQVAETFGCDPRELVWTSGATEADNLAIKGVAEARAADGKRHFVTSIIEHKAVLDSFCHLETLGFEVTWLTPGPAGVVAPEQVAAALRPETSLVSLMLVNNELGTCTDTAAMGALLREHGVVLHVDAAQAPGKLPFDLGALGADLVSLSAHKFYGPKGMGALYVRRAARVPIRAQIHGGGHERGLRSGTLATHQIVGMGAACERLREEGRAETERVARLRSRFLDGLASLSGLHVNGDPTRRVPGILNLAFEGVDGEALLMALAPDVACSSGSACNSAAVEPSHVLRGIGLDDALAHASIRFSFGRFTTAEEVDHAAGILVERVSRLRASRARTA
ncbi:MAG: aminotransferase class V-fold PLP-dependent enzyme [Pseudomonadales bacterium]|jgi:cysteine desulfurase|nr:aminotransferase class V-fold PLP-dependent enzyme [Pseudomonadales bacterium]